MAIIIASAVQLFRKRDWTSKTKIFFSFFEKLGGGREIEKIGGKFFCFETQISQKFASESGAK